MNPWFARGGIWTRGTGAGVFAFDPTHGFKDASHSFRINYYVRKYLKLY